LFSENTNFFREICL